MNRFFYMRPSKQRTTAFALFFAFLLLVPLCAAYGTVQGELKRQGALGVQVAPVPAEQRSALRLPDGQGLLVREVVPASAAAEAGVKTGDVVLALNDQPIGTTGLFVAAVQAMRAGDAARITVLRDGQQQALNATLKPRPFEKSDEAVVIYDAVKLEDGTRRRVIVTKPLTVAGKTPAVLLVGGLGCYSNDNLSPDNPYHKLLYGLVRKGFVTMRVEKSGMGDSEGAACNSPAVDMETEARGYIAGLRALKGYDYVDPDRVFIFGHSIGGLVGPVIASREPVKGLIVAETVGTSWYDYSMENIRRQRVLKGVPYDEVENDVRKYRNCKQLVWFDSKTPADVIKENPDCVGMVEDAAPHTYMRQIAGLNLADTWKRVNAQVLVIYGASDFVTSAEEHHYLRDMLNKFRPGSATYVEIPEMDHWFERTASQQSSLARISAPPAGPPLFNESILTESLKWLETTSAKQRNP